MIDPAAKNRMHPRNRFRDGYDFATLAKETPALGRFVSPNAHGDLSIDYANPEAVKALNQALLASAYGIKGWNVPGTYLCPPIPGRSDYIHHAADLIGDSPSRRPGGVNVLDIGTGASAIYPLIGASEYGWRFAGTDIDPVALDWARRNADCSRAVGTLIDLRLQASPLRSFEGVVRGDEFFDLTICNPPFYASAEDAAAGNARKRRNLDPRASSKAVRNFGGHSAELWCRGGELGFIRRMIEESVTVRDRCVWFTTLVSKSEHLRTLQAALVEAKALDTRTIPMGQGQKQTRFLAWTFGAKA